MFVAYIIYTYSKTTQLVLMKSQEIILRHIRKSLGSSLKTTTCGCLSRSNYFTKRGTPMLICLLTEVSTLKLR